jgi:hypothetical protein
MRKTGMLAADADGRGCSLGVIEDVPYRVHTVLTDNGTHFTDGSGTVGSSTDS